MLPAPKCCVLINTMQLQIMYASHSNWEKQSYCLICKKKKKGHGTIQDLFIMKKGWRASFNLSGLREREREHQERPKKRTLRTGCVVKNGNYTEKMRQEYNLRTAGDSKSGGRGKGARESSLGGMGEGSRPAGAGTARAPGRPRRRAT